METISILTKILAIVTALLTQVQANTADINMLKMQAPHQQTFGATAGDTFSFPCENHNGVTTCFAKGSMKSATTTVCTLQAPTFATSTLRTGAVAFNVSSTSASTVTVAKASSAFATTTLIRTVSIAANGRANFPVASTSAAALSQAQDDLTFKPGQFVVVGMAGGTGTFSPTGSCSAEFLVHN